MILDEFARIGQGLDDDKLDGANFMTVVDTLQANLTLLDEIQQPHLLHGDLWAFNILISQKSGWPEIAGILDADRAWWGDPMADWTMFIWAKGTGRHMAKAKSVFWQGYGLPEQTMSVRFRAEIYNALHLGRMMILYNREKNQGAVERGQYELGEVVRALSDLELQ